MKRFLFIVALAALAVSCKTPAIESAVVFAENSDSCHFYRIPAMTLDAKGNVVAVVDRRYESLADLGYRNTSIDISVKRSVDGGKTWGPQSYIARGDTGKVKGYCFDDTYWNGSKVGSGRLWSKSREYPIPARLVKAGRNEILIRNTDDWPGVTSRVL